MHHMDIQMDYHVWSAMLEHHQTHAKAGQLHAKMKDRFVAIQNICFTSSLLRQLYHFATDRVLLRLVGTHNVNTV